MPSISFKTKGIWILGEAKGHKMYRIRFIKGKSSNVDTTLLRFKEEVLEYFEGRRKKFKVPFLLDGASLFQRKVYNYLVKKVAYGRTTTYKKIATDLGNEKLALAVGRALSKNPLPLLIPCHRVVKSDGKIGGFLGGVGIKNVLLELEKN